MIITQTETVTGGPERTPREQIKQLFTGTREAEPEDYVDVSPSLANPWRSNRNVNTWSIMIPAMFGFLRPWAALDSQAGHEAGGGGVATYPFSDVYLPLSDKKDEDGEIIIDLNPSNAEERWAYFVHLHRNHFENGMPTWGGTRIMSAVSAGDEHFMGELGSRPLDRRPVRGRAVWTDGELQDYREFQSYLASATTVKDENGNYNLGRHGEWDEKWAVAICGERGGGGEDAYKQYKELAKDHPQVHPYFFQDVINPGEISEDMAFAVIPTQA